MDAVGHDGSCDGGLCWAGPGKEEEEEQEEEEEEEETQDDDIDFCYDLRLC